MTILQSGYPNLLGFKGKQLFNKSVAVTAFVWDADGDFLNPG